MTGSSPRVRKPFRWSRLASAAAGLALLAAFAGLGACRAPAAPLAPPSLPDDVPTWPAARFESLEQIPQMGRQLHYACDAAPAEVADFYTLQLRQRGWSVQRAPADAQETRGAERDHPIELSAAKAGRALGLSIRSRRSGCEIELLLLEPEGSGTRLPEM